MHLFASKVWMASILTILKNIKQILVGRLYFHFMLLKFFLIQGKLFRK